jgi:uncharacterized protein YfdQ (DUF2303 family)
MEQIQAPSPARFTLVKNGVEFDYIVKPQGWTSEIVENEELDHTPPVVEGEQSVANTASFKAYFSRFADERSILFASRSRGVVRAELDYHLNAETPAPSKHALTRTFKKDRKFVAWKQRNGQQQTQAQFVEFLEDHLDDVRDPNQADLLRSIVQFKAFRTANCASAVDLSSGDVQFQFTQETKGVAGQAVLPERILIEVPVLEFERAWKIAARLKYRLNEGKLVFWFELIRIEDVEDEAFRTAVDDLSKEIGAGILLAD